MGVPNAGQTGTADFSGPQKPMRRLQTKTARGPMGVPRLRGTGAGMGIGSGAPLMGGGGMAVGPLRDATGRPRHPPVNHRAALLSGLKG